MKKTTLLLAILLLSVSSAIAEEPLLLNYLPEVTPEQAVQTDPTGQTMQTQANNTMNATFVPAKKLQDDKMIPQNNAAKGLPVTVQTPRVTIETKQGRQTNTQWNPGGKGTKSYF